MNPSLSNIERLSAIYNHPQMAFPTIHVAGTNGKGSVCTKIASALQAGGYVTGLYTSPHIATFRERIKVNGQLISEEETASLFSEIQKTISHLTIPATFFEIATLLAFLHFQRKSVDVAVIETGLGGRWDATNVVNPLVSIITSIGYDHTEILGPSLEDIAREKAGIIKKGKPVVLGPDVPFSLMKEKADALGCLLYQSSFQSEDFDRENQETARCALAFLAPHFPLAETAICAGLKVKPPCRFEQHQRQKGVVFDVAHNAHGFARLLQLLKYTYPNSHYRFVLGFSQGKDIAECARLIQDHACAIHLVSGPHPRLAQTEDLSPTFAHRKEIVHLEKTIRQGVQNALQAPPSKQEVVVIAGSFFIMSEARKALGFKDPEDPSLWYDPVKVLQSSLSMAGTNSNISDCIGCS